MPIVCNAYTVEKLNASITFLSRVCLKSLSTLGNRNCFYDLILIIVRYWVVLALKLFTGISLWFTRKTHITLKKYIASYLLLYKLYSRASSTKHNNNEEFFGSNQVVNARENRLTVSLPTLS